MNDNYYMKQALELAEQAATMGEVPVGAIVVLDDKIIGRGFNQMVSANDPTAHAEIVAMRDAAKNIGNYRLNKAILYVTLEPCMMCASAMVHARIKRLVFGSTDSKTGVAGGIVNLFDLSFLNHKIIIDSGVLANECGKVLKDFFKSRR